MASSITEGWLVKSGKHLKWNVKRRWVVLDDTALVWYTSTECVARNEPSGSLPVAAITGCRLSTVLKRQSCFEVCHTGPVDVFFVGQDKFDAQRWMDAITKKVVALRSTLSAAGLRLQGLQPTGSASLTPRTAQLLPSIRSGELPAVVPAPPACAPATAASASGPLVIPGSGTAASIARSDSSDSLNIFGGLGTSPGTSILSTSPTTGAGGGLLLFTNSPRVATAGVGVGFPTAQQAVTQVGVSLRASASGRAGGAPDAPPRMAPPWRAGAVSPFQGSDGVVGTPLGSVPSNPMPRMQNHSRVVVPVPVPTAPVAVSATPAGMQAQALSQKGGAKQ